MKVTNWTEINAATPGGRSKLPAGGYVIKILKVEDVESKEYLRITYDIAEGEYKDHYAEDTGANEWRHQFVRSYKDSAATFFAQFLQAITASNADFDLAKWQKVCNPYELEGLILGSIWRDDLYTNDRGEDKERLEFFAAVPADRIRAGAYEVPKPNDRRTAPDPYAPGADIPF